LNKRTAGLASARLALAGAALAFAAVHLPAQQPYGYGQQYAAPAPQYNYAQPQYAQPQYQQPQYSQPHYAQPQYAQPQYAQPQYQQTPPAQPQYAQPEYSQPGYAQQPEYSQQPGYAQQPGYTPQQQQPDNAQQPYAGPDQPYADLGQPDDMQPQGSQPQSAPAQPLSAQDLEQLVAPIALYPDNLLAQILAASTYPAQVAVADQWVNSMRAQGYGSPDQIAAGAQAQTGWDPSVKALTAFPQVLDTLNQNLQWTTALGNAYYNQPQDVMQTVQVLRQRAEQAGNLQDTPQQDVTNDQGYLEVAPADPQTVYVPAYNPWYAYGQPMAPYPGFSLAGGVGSFFGASPVQFGLGIAMAAFERMPFGWMGWGLSWLSHSILFNHSAYATHSSTVADWGFPHGGQRVFGYREGGRGMPGNGYRTPQPMSRSGNSYQSARGGAYGRPDDGARPGYGYSGAERSDGYARGNGSTHPEMPGQMAYNRMPQQYARPQTYASRPQTYAGAQGYARPAYDYNRPAQSYGSRPGMAYASPSQGYRSPAYQTPSYRDPEFNSSRGYNERGGEAYGNSFARNEHSGGFHLFGNGRESGGFEGGRAPKSFRGESFGGGHAPKSFGHERAPKESHSGGHGHRR
jgi:hypothetical protein